MLFRAGPTPDGAPWQVKIRGPSSTTKNPFSSYYDSARGVRTKISFKNYKCAQSAPEIYAFRRKNMILRRGPGALRPPWAPSGPLGPPRAPLLAQAPWHLSVLSGGRSGPRALTKSFIKNVLKLYIAAKTFSFWTIDASHQSFKSSKLKRRCIKNRYIKNRY